MHPRSPPLTISGTGKKSDDFDILGVTFDYNSIFAKELGSFIILSVSLRNELSDPVFDGVGLIAFKSK